MQNVATSDFAQKAQGGLLHEASGGYEFIYQETGQGLRVISHRGTDYAVGQVRWLLGAGVQGETPIVQSGPNFYESRVSFFPQLQQFGITVGQSAEASANAAAALGRKESRSKLLECLSCHATVADDTFAEVTPGVSCERCHAGAEAHSDDPKKAVVNPGSLHAREQVQLCGACHRNAPPVDDQQLENVRFQPYRLMKSRCFLQGEIKCTTCHAAHVDARRADAAYYDAKCVGCHAQAHSRADQKVSGSCISCHMPQIQLHPALHFTDHYIRVVKSSDYPAGVISRRVGD